MTASTQSEFDLEKRLLEQLQALGYEKAHINNEDDMLRNLKRQLEIHNDVALTDEEFSGVLHHLNRGDIFDRAKTLRDRYFIRREGQDGVWLRFLNTDNWCMNEYQVTHQVEMTGKRKTRYDVTLLINASRAGTGCSRPCSCPSRPVDLAPACLPAGCS